MKPPLASRSKTFPRPVGRLLLFLLLCLAAAPALRAQDATPAAAATPAVESKDNLLAVIKAAGKYTTFLKVLDAAGLASTLEQAGPYTVFVPTDEAFSKLPPGTLDRLLKPESKPKLVAVVKYHIASGKVGTAALGKMEELKTLNGEEIDVDTTTDGKTIEMDDSKIIGPQIEASNGIVHVVDAVLEP